MAPQKIQKILRQTKKPPLRYQSQPRNEEKEKANIYPEKSYTSLHYQDTQQIKYIGTHHLKITETLIHIGNNNNIIINQHCGSIAQTMNMH